MFFIVTARLTNTTRVHFKTNFLDISPRGKNNQSIV